MEGLRGFAVTLVFLQHYAVQAQLIGLAPGPASVVAAAFRNYGNVGVELFFVLSGYLIYGHLVHRPPFFAVFMRRRIQRIYPTFLVVFAFTMALIILVPIPGKLPIDHWQAMAYVLANIALLPGLFPIEPIMAVAWSLSYEMFFYVTAAALVLGTGFRRISARWRIAFLGLLGSAFILISLGGIPNFPTRMMPFFAGMLLAEGLGNRVPAWVGWAAPLMAFVACATHALTGVTEELFHTIAFFSLCAVCFHGIGLVSAWMTATPLRWLGNMSYSYYLIHGVVVRIVMVLLGRVLPLGLPDWLFWTLAPILYVATLVASCLLFVMVERPVSLRPMSAKVPSAVAS